MYSFDKVADGVYLGNELTAYKKKILQAGCITHIVAAGAELTPHFPEDFQYLRLKIRDSPSEKLLAHLDLAIDFIEQAQAAGGTVFVHCAQGISRSCAIVIGFIMRKQRLSYLQAYAQVKASHVETTPNIGFVHQLMLYERHIKNPSNFNLKPTSCACAIF